MFSFVDAHCHIQQFDEPEEWLSQFVSEEGVKLDLFVDGVCPGEDWDRVSRLYETTTPDKRSRVFPSYGVHPWWASEALTTHRHWHTDLTQRLRDCECAGVGEIGLDKSPKALQYVYWDVYVVYSLFRRSCWEDQVSVCKKQIEIGVASQRPLSIHCVRAHSELLKLLEEGVGTHKPGIILHSYSGTSNMVTKLLPLNCYFSFSAAIATNHKKTNQAIRAVPLDRLLVESDSPDQPAYDVHFQAFTNESGALSSLAKQMASSKFSTRQEGESRKSAKRNEPAIIPFVIYTLHQILQEKGEGAGVPELCDFIELIYNNAERIKNFQSALWLIFSVVFSVISLDVLEWLLSTYTLNHFPTAEDIRHLQILHPSGGQRIYQGGRLFHILLNSLLYLRTHAQIAPVLSIFIPSQSLLPIYATPPLHVPLPSYDFIVIGAGSAGSVLTGGLASASNTSVLLLDAGEPPVNGFFSTELLPIAALLRHGTSADWGYRTEPQKYACQGHPNKTSFWPRGKSLGGSSTINFMLYHKGNPRDYDLWATCLNDDRWSAESVGRVMQQLENFELPAGGGADGRVPFPRGYSGPLKVSTREPQSLFSTAFIEAARWLGIADASTYNIGVNGTGVSPLELLKGRREGKRISPYRAFVTPHYTHTKLHVLPYSRVTRLILDKRRVVGVEYTLIPPSVSEKHLSPTELRALPRLTVNVTKEIILSAGSIGTPQLLLLSGIGPSRQIDLPGVGQHLIDHILHPVVARIKEAHSSDVLTISNTLRLMNIRDAMKGRGVFTSPGANTQLLTERFGDPPREVPAFCRHAMRSRSKTRQQQRILQELMDVPDIQMLLYEGMPDYTELRQKLNVPEDMFLRLGNPYDWKVDPQALPVNGTTGDIVKILNQSKRFGKNLSHVLLLPVLLNPESRGSLHLKSDNPFESPAIDPNYLHHPRDLKILMKGIRLAQRLTKTPPWSRISYPAITPNCPDSESPGADLSWRKEYLKEDQVKMCRHHDADSDASWEHLLQYLTLTLYHPAGTCRMGDPLHDAMACVDSQLRVIGVEGLRVADASVLPTLPTGNPQVPIMMIGQMAVNLIKSNHNLT